ncbi:MULTISPECIES: acetolactate synthase [Novipirellula]|uniref:Acetolactate synthase n=1 Tax=Novipirellula rosea TaxID=1031540 RepID=A0ABP8NPF1_9BACT
MSVGDGSDSVTAYQTSRGRNYPALRQFTVFLENRVGQLLEVVKRFEGTGIRICALSISDAAECAFVRFLVSDADRGREILERSGLAIIETDLIGVELPTGPQPLLRVCTALLQAELNIVQAYPLLVRPHGKPAVAIMVENIDFAMKTLLEKGFQILTEGDLEDNPINEQ